MQVCSQDFGQLNDEKAKRKLDFNVKYNQNSSIIRMEIPEALAEYALVNLTFTMG